MTRRVEIYYSEFLERYVEFNFNEPVERYSEASIIYWFKSGKKDLFTLTRYVKELEGFAVNQRLFLVDSWVENE